MLVGIRKLLAVSVADAERGGPGEVFDTVEVAAAQLADWAAGIFRLRGEQSGLVRLGAEEADAAHREYGWTVG
ncbi:hypothetical protein ACIGFK_02700 [Streptomyces sp. NPDC085524]|uniref:hypothetical protein n=1 Tax=unclassified Streptomyces TaxID=2593676 RepID=UPI0035E0D904